MVGVGERDIMKEAIDEYRGFLLYKYVIIISTIMGSLFIASESNCIAKEWHSYIIIVQQIFFGVLTIDYILYFKKAINRGEILRYIFSFNGIIDLITFITFLLTFFNSYNDIKSVLGIVSFLKITRFSDALTIFKDVIINERKSLLASIYLMILITLFLSTLLYFTERDINPNGFSSIIDSMWWVIITLATAGYGDIIPITILGKSLGAMASIIGLVMFALPAAILVNGFAQELERVRYITSWNLVAKVPIFSQLDKRSISEIARILFLRRFSKGEVVIKEGDVGDSMYFILDGEVEVTRQKDDLHIILKSGDFIGEIALIEDTTRTATVIAKKRLEMLELTTYDFNKLVRAKPYILDKIKEVADARSS